MVIKKHIQCGECGKNIDIYIEEKRNLRGVTVSCDCGHKQICIKDNKNISKWRTVEKYKV